jgi:hypothetical protein
VDLRLTRTGAEAGQVLFRSSGGGTGFVPSPVASRSRLN